LVIKEKVPKKKVTVKEQEALAPPPPIPPPSSAEERQREADDAREKVKMVEKESTPRRWSPVMPTEIRHHREDSPTYQASLAEVCFALQHPQRMGIAQGGTPISKLLSSIQDGFLLTPTSPLSPPDSYLPRISEESGSPGEGPIPFPLHGFTGEKGGSVEADTFALLFGMPSGVGKLVGERPALSEVVVNRVV
jgi:hypothetical protein